MATIDIKLKSYDELTFEITKLNTDIYLKNKEIKRLNNQYDLMEKSLDEKQEIIDKAIELINAWLDGLNNDDIIILLNNLGNILNGGE